MRYVRFGILVFALLITGFALQHRAAAREDLPLLTDWAKLDLQVARTRWDTKIAASSGTYTPPNGTRIAIVELKGTAYGDGMLQLGPNDFNAVGVDDNGMIQSIPSIMVLTGSDAYFADFSSPRNTPDAWNAPNMLKVHESDPVGVTVYFVTPKALSSFTVRVMADVGTAKFSN